MSGVLLTLLSALSGALALPPFDWSGFAWLAPALLLLAVRGERPGSAFRYGILYGYLYGWATTWSIAEVGAQYFDLGFPIAMAAFAVYYFVVIGIPYGLFTAGSVLLLRHHPGRRGQLLVPFLWVGAELVRSRLFAQPWALLAYTQHAHPALLQVAAVTGVYGVSFLVVLGGVGISETIARLHAGRGVRRAAIASVWPLGIVLACWGGGAASLATIRDDPAGAREVAVVQTNVSPARHWTRSYTQAQLQAHMRATDSLPSDASPALVVWPENAVPRYLETDPMLAAQLATMSRRHRADLLFGAPRYEAGRSYNSARLLTPDGHDGGYYDKRRLVLFAEEKPLASAVGRSPGESPEEFTAGTGSGVLHGFVRLGVSICHEITHPDLIAQTVRDGAELLVNIANDGWLDAGSEFAGRQHLAMSVFRAVETRRYLVRASTTGPSAVIDPYGRVVASLAPGTHGVLRARVRPSQAITPYVRLGDCLAVVGALLAAVTALSRRRPVEFATSIVPVPLAP